MQQQLPTEWVERIFMRLHGRFGNAFFDKFRVGQLNADGEDIGILNAKQVWAEELANLSVERIKKGLAAKFEYAPSADDFIQACSPVPACHRDPNILLLPKPKLPDEVVQKKLKAMYETLKIKKMPA
jgi:hypothetical protein